MNISEPLKNNLSPEQRLKIKSLLPIIEDLALGMEDAVKLRKGCLLSKKILVATHHKTGTVWLTSLFRTICRYHSLNYYKGEQVGVPVDYDVFFQNHSQFDLASLNAPYKGIHIIRDPRDVIISGCFYHQKSKEEWLHEPRASFGGMTYQEKIKSYDKLDDQILFEMENIGRGTIEKMLSWNYHQPEFLEVKYEDLIQDYDLELFHEIFTFLGFPGSVIPSLLSIAYNKSIFSGDYKKSVHIRSGKTKQWAKHFKQVHCDRFVELFGDALLKLEYESSQQWSQTRDLLVT